MKDEKVELSVNGVKAYKGKRGTAPLILSLGTRWRLVFFLTSLLLCDLVGGVV
jgi:hypothetical protein